MKSSALRQSDLFEAAPIDAVGVWLKRLYAAFQTAPPKEGYLPLAERALEAIPGDPELLLMAANAALLDDKLDQAQLHLKRFSKRATAPAAELLRAFLLNRMGAKAAARTILEREGLTNWMEVYKHFPAGRAHADWMFQQLDEILNEPKPARRKPAAAKAKAVAKPAAKPKPKPQPKPVAAAAIAKPAAAEPALPPLPLPPIDIPLSLEIDLAPLTAALAGLPEPEGRWFGLRQQWSHLGLAQGFDELLCLPQLTGIEPLWHQVETVRKVLKQFRGRVLLADEVGLGKTIEAGMVLKEYALRGMAERALVLVPASLVGQWREELETKFGLTFATTYDPLLRDDPDAFWAQPRVIASIASARRKEHAERLASRQYDLVIVDEAHHLRDRSSASWKLVDALNKRFLLLLSATPVQNDLVELYTLLTLLEARHLQDPGRLPIRPYDARQAARARQSRRPARADAGRHDPQHPRRGGAEAAAPARHHHQGCWRARRGGGLCRSRSRRPQAGDRGRRGRQEPAPPAEPAQRGRDRPRQRRPERSRASPNATPRTSTGPRSPNASLPSGRAARKRRCSIS